MNGDGLGAIAASQWKHSVLSDLEAMVPHQHIGPESSHSTLHACECSLHPGVCMILDEKASIISLSLVVTISSYSVECPIPLVATLSSSTMAVSLPGPPWDRLHRCIDPRVLPVHAYLSLSLITFMMLLIMGVPRITGYPCHIIGQIWDYKGYLIFIIALDSIYLNLYDDVAHRSGKCVSHAYTGMTPVCLWGLRGGPTSLWMVFSMNPSIMVFICSAIV